MHLALIEAVRVLTTTERGASLRELAAHACVGLVATRHTLHYLVRSGALVIARTRRVPYRNRPVSEYALPPDTAPADAPMGFALGAALTAWHTCSRTPKNFP